VRRAIGLLAVFASLLAATGATAQVGRPQEYEVKAAYLYSFGKFVEWPAPSTPAESASFLVCVLGQDPFGPTLDETVVDAVVRDRPVVIRRVTRAEDAVTCQVVFISASEDAALEPALTILGRSPVLTVGDLPRFAERGGMVEFVVQASRVRFAVNRSAAEAAGLALSSELLRVATRVLGTPGAGR